MRNIHSTRSISQIALKTKEKLMGPDENNRSDNVQLGESVRKYEEVRVRTNAFADLSFAHKLVCCPHAECGCCFGQPKIVTAETCHEYRLENKKRLSNLPYMNRNPAV